MKNINPGIKEAAASEPNPINKRRPPRAITAVQALCNKIKRKLVRLTSQAPCRCLFSAGTPVCSVTTLVSSSESLSAPSVDAPRWSEVTTKITRSAMRSSGLCPHIRKTPTSQYVVSFRLWPESSVVYPTLTEEEPRVPPTVVERKGADDAVGLRQPPRDGGGARPAAGPPSGLRRK